MTKKKAPSAKDKPAVVMIHGAFVGPWSVEEFAEKFRAAGYVVHTPCLRFHDLGKPPAALGSDQSGRLYAADLEEAVGGLTNWMRRQFWWAIRMGGLLAQMLAARREIRALCFVGAFGALGVCRPPPCSRSAAAQAMLLQCGLLEFRSCCRTSHHRGLAFPGSLQSARNPAMTPCSSAFGPESGRATFEMMHWGLDMNRASEVDVAQSLLPACWCWRAARTACNPPGTVEAHCRALWRSGASSSNNCPA